MYSKKNRTKTGYKGKKTGKNYFLRFFIFLAGGSRMKK